jgi:DNA repair exonuclease SbcCD ATPase subunit
MKFKKIQWKNLLSYGNMVQTLEFKDTPNLVIIEGENGSGKSSIKEALTISTYGKSAIRKMKDLPNWINRNLYTRVELETSSGDEVVIERGIDPNFSKIYRNSVPYNLPDKRKIDEYIEEELLNLSFSIFCNTISLSFDDFKSFINLNATDKRKIIDPMFGIDILSDMKEIVKDKLKEDRKKIDASETQITRSTSLLDNSMTQLSNLRAKIKENKKDKSDKLSTEIKELQTSLKNHQSEYKKIKEEVDSKKEGLTSLGNEIVSMNQQIKDLNSKLTLFEKNTCPHCLNDLTSQTSLNIKDELNSKLKNQNSKIEKFKIKYNSLKEEVNRIAANRDAEKESFYSVSAKIESLETELKKADVEEDNQEESILSIISTIKQTIKESEEEIKTIRIDVEVYEVVNEMLSDNGIKKNLMDKIIPLLNDRITEISQILDFKFNFQFDNEFNAVITYLGLEVSSDSLSTGQKKKMNLIVLLAFIEIIKMKYNNMNVMFLDEIFSGLDKQNVYRAIKILKDYSIRYNMTIFVVSHESLPEELFDSRIEVKNINEFSQMSIKDQQSQVKNLN